MKLINLLMMNQKNIQYFYIQMNSFVKYDNQHYTICKEDDLQYHILTSLSKTKNLTHGNIK